MARAVQAQTRTMAHLGQAEAQRFGTDSTEPFRRKEFRCLCGHYQLLSEPRFQLFDVAGGSAGIWSVSGLQPGLGLALTPLLLLPLQHKKKNFDWRLCLCTEFPGLVCLQHTLSAIICLSFSLSLLGVVYLFDLLQALTVNTLRVQFVPDTSTCDYCPRRYVLPAPGHKRMPRVVNKGCTFHNTHIIVLLVERWSSGGISDYVNRQRSLMGRAGCRHVNTVHGQVSPPQGALSEHIEPITQYTTRP